VTTLYGVTGSVVVTTLFATARLSADAPAPILPDATAASAAPADARKWRRPTSAFRGVTSESRMPGAFLISTQASVSRARHVGQRVLDSM
jgi:hypothetical protein